MDMLAHCGRATRENIQTKNSVSGNNPLSELPSCLWDQLAEQLCSIGCCHNSLLLKVEVAKFVPFSLLKILFEDFQC